MKKLRRSKREDIPQIRKDITGGHLWMNPKRRDLPEQGRRALSNGKEEEKGQEPKSSKQEVFGARGALNK